MDQVAIRSGPEAAPREPFSVRKFLRQLKDAAFEIVPFVITLLLVIEFAIREILPIIGSILHLLGLA